MTNKAFWGNIADHNYMSGHEKDNLLKQIIKVRDAPSEFLYNERESKLLEMTVNLNVRPGQATKPIKFHEYYEKNWRSCAMRWVFAFRKNLPTNGANDTQAIESTFSAIKRFSKLEFPGRTPTLSELIQILPRALDERSAAREQEVLTKRLTIYDPDPEVNKALALASWKLNREGMKKFHESLKMAQEREKNMTLEGNIITETYTGASTKDYIGKYESDGFSCNCSWFASKRLCRHPFFFRKQNNLPLFDIQIFHRSFHYQNENLDDTVHENFPPFSERLASPGMEHLVDEQMNNNKKMKSNHKFNKAFDVAKVCAEYLSKYGTEDFLSNYEVFQSFTELMRTGIPQNVKDAILSHKSSKPSNSPKKSAKLSSSEDGLVTVEERVVSVAETSKKEKIRDLPQEHQLMMTELMVVFPAKGDGACLYNALAAFLYGDKSQSPHLRRMANQFIVMNWWYWTSWYSFPFTEKVGVGKECYEVTFTCETEFHDFLQSDSSLLMWSTQTDIAVLSNLCNLNIHSFTYNIKDRPPQWYTTPPDPNLTFYTAMDDGPTRDVCLYNSNNCHYDLLVTPDSRLALLGTVDVMSQVELEATAPNISEDDIPSSPTLKNSLPPHISSDPVQISPLTFIPCPRGPGRPKITRHGAASVKRKNMEEALIDPPVKKRRGRPPGSKNKPKPTSNATDNTIDKQTDDILEKIMYSNNDICNICHFYLNDTIKQHIKITTCIQCKSYVHEPCMMKSGCTCS